MANRIAGDRLTRIAGRVSAAIIAEGVTVDGICTIAAALNVPVESLLVDE